jgi:hypothetical protein
MTSLNSGISYSELDSISRISNRYCHRGSTSFPHPTGTDLLDDAVVSDYGVRCELKIRSGAVVCVVIWQSRQYPGCGGSRLRLLTTACLKILFMDNKGNKLGRATQYDGTVGGIGSRTIAVVGLFCSPKKVDLAMKVESVSGFRECKGKVVGANLAQIGFRTQYPLVRYCNALTYWLAKSMAEEEDSNGAFSHSIVALPATSQPNEIQGATPRKNPHRIIVEIKSTM